MIRDYAADAILHRSVGSSTERSRHMAALPFEVQGTHTAPDGTTVVFIRQPAFPGGTASAALSLLASLGDIKGDRPAPPPPRPRPLPRPALCGRNEPCPCGSGRKYKRCHRSKPL